MKKVIIADDSDFIRSRLQSLLLEIGDIEVAGLCENGTDALEMMKSVNPRLAVLDISMPGMSGLDVLKEIRKENRTMQIIILTLHDTDYHRRMAMESGADYFFSKVDDFDKIAPLVGEIMNGKAER